MKRLALILAATAALSGSAWAEHLAPVTSAQMPAFVGDAASSAGSNTLTVQPGAITAGKMAAGATVGNLGYTPPNKAGDSGLGPMAGAGFYGPSDARYYGIPLNGTSDDNAALSQLRTAAPNGAIVTVPPSDKYQPQSAITGGPQFVIWDVLGGLTINGFPITQIGSQDLFQGYLYGRTKYIQRTNTADDGGNPLLRVDLNNNYSLSGGSQSNGAAAVYNCSSSRGSSPSSVYCFQVHQTSRSKIATSANNIAGALYNVKPIDADYSTPLAETFGFYSEMTDRSGLKSSLSGPQVGYELDNYVNDVDDANGRIILAMNCGSYSPAFNATYSTASKTLTNVTGLNAAPVAGQPIGGLGNIPTVVSFDPVAMTITMSAFPAISGTGSLNIGITPGQCAYGVTIGKPAAGGAVGAPFDINTSFFTAGFDASRGTSVGGAPAFRMAGGQSFSFDAANAHLMGYDGGGIFSFHFTGSANGFQIPDGGGFRVGYSGSDPAAGGSFFGALYYNNSTNQLRIYNGTAWGNVRMVAGTPTGSTMACTPGDQMADASFHYDCVSTNSWRRIASSTF